MSAALYRQATGKGRHLSRTGLILLIVWKLSGAKITFIYTSLVGYLVFQVGCLIFVVLTARQALGEYFLSADLKMLSE